MESKSGFYLFLRAYCENCDHIGGYAPYSERLSQLPLCERCQMNSYNWHSIKVPNGSIFIWEEKDI